MSRSFAPRGRRPVPGKSPAEVAEVARRLKAEQQASSSYRERSLQLHGWICAKCARVQRILAMIKNLKQLNLQV